MTRHKLLKKELARLRYHLSRAVQLKELSETYGDDFVTDYDIIKIKAKIKEVEREYEEHNTSR